MLLYLPAILWALLNIFSLSAKAKPQDTNVFEDVPKSGLMVIGNMAETFSNGALISKSMGFESPFARGNSETQIGAGGAMRNNDDDSSEERRRKRALDLDTNAPCHTGGGGATGGGGSTGGDDIDVAEARRRAYNRAKRAKKARQNARKNKKKYFSSNGDDESEVQQPSERRRKRQTEVDDLNANMTDAGNSFAQHAQQFAEKLSNIFQGFMNSMNEMAQRLKQQFSGGGGGATANDEEV